MALPKKNTGVIVATAKHTIALPAGTLGFSKLVEPDEYDPDKPTFKLNVHYTGEAIEQLVEIVGEKVYTEEALARLWEEAIPAKYKKVDPQAPATWVEGKLKEPRDNDVVALPYIAVANRATYKTKDGEIKPRVIAAWDAANHKLDLKKLRLGKGSIIQPVVRPNIYINKLVGIPQPSLKLVGIKVLKLIRWTGNGAGEVETDEEAIREVLGEEFAFDDLAAYAAGAEEEEAEASPPSEEADRLFGTKDEE